MELERKRAGSRKIALGTRSHARMLAIMAPAARAYVPIDVAVRFLAGQLRFFAQNEAAFRRLDKLALHQQKAIVRLVGFLSIRTITESV